MIFAWLPYLTTYSVCITILISFTLPLSGKEFQIQNMKNENRERVSFFKWMSERGGIKTTRSSDYRSLTMTLCHESVFSFRIQIYIFCECLLCIASSSGLFSISTPPESSIRCVHWTLCWLASLLACWQTPVRFCPLILHNMTHFVRIEIYFTCFFIAFVICSHCSTHSSYFSLFSCTLPHFVFCLRILRTQTRAHALLACVGEFRGCVKCWI